MGEETSVLSAKNLQSTLCCRICHEEEDLQNSRLEAPCSCSGTVKFAHRECVQRWCDQKGNITCEICLQEYGPGYTATPKKVQMMQEAVTIRSLEFPTEEDDEDGLLDTESPDCSVAARTASCCKSIALMLTALLLVRHLFDALSGEESYPFSLQTIIALKSCGIIIPMYIIIHAINSIQNSIRKYNRLQQLQQLRLLGHSRSHEEEQRLHITIEIQPR